MFRLKRAFQRSLAHVRPLIGEFGLTAARFDMMKAIRDGASNGAVLQSAIRRALGVSAATVSRMLKSLEALRFVIRTIDPGDKRERRVALTDEGRRRFDEAASELLVSGAMDLSFASVVVTTTADWPQREERAAQTLERLDAIRQGLRDVAEDYLYRVTPWFCPGHATQRGPSNAIYDEIEAIDCTEATCQSLLLRVQLARIGPY